MVYSTFRKIYKKIRKKYPRLYCWLYIIRSFPILFRAFGWKSKLKNKVTLLNKTVIILGSGPTYWDFKNYYKKKRFVDCIIVGIGRTIYDDLIPDIYLFELKNNEDENMIDHIFDILSQKKKEYEKVPLLLKNSYGNKKFQTQVLKKIPPPLQKNVIFTNEIQAPHGTNLIARTFLSDHLLIRFIRYSSAAIQCRSTTFMATMLAFELGASNVILAGVDGKGGYFFENLPNNKEYIYHHTRVSGKNKNPIGKNGIHSVANISAGKPTITRLMIEINRAIGPVFVVSKKSLLGSWLKNYKN